METDAADIARGYKALLDVEYWFFRKFVPAVEVLSDLVEGVRDPQVA
jgi:hypothetical protein